MTGPDVASKEGRRRSSAASSRPRACQLCRAGKTKCDKNRPACKACVVHERECIYSSAPPKPRPSRALIKAAEVRKRVLEQVLIKLKTCAKEERDDILASLEVVGTSINVPGSPSAASETLEDGSQLVVAARSERNSGEAAASQITSDDEEDDTLLTEREVAQFLSLDEDGQIGALGPTSALHNPVEAPDADMQPQRNLANQLFVNAVLQRQFESKIWTLNNIDGVSIELATHLHDLHWNRQHHTLLLTYRPLYTRDLLSGGPYWSKFLSNAIFASVSKFSNRPEVRDDPSDPRTSGGRFLRRCDALLIEESPFDHSSIPTAIGLMLLSSTYLARGDVSKSWKYCGLAIRMMFDLGLHLDCARPGLTAADMEIRRRVFWGMFIYDKLQSLYLGRPVAIQLCDSFVSCNFMDNLEENEPWSPYVDPSDPRQPMRAVAPTPLHSVTCFQQFCELAKLMTKIVTRFYVAGVRIKGAEAKLLQLDHDLGQWKSNLPKFLVFEPFLNAEGRASHMVAPNIVLINSTYHALCILLHRPFISESRLRKDAGSKASWDKCSHAAKMITNIMTAYRTGYSLRGAPYLASYACYVACTIHVRNAALSNRTYRGDKLAKEMLDRTLVMLSELSESSPCAMRAVQIIHRLMNAHQLQRTIGRLLNLLDLLSEGKSIRKIFANSLPEPIADISLSPALDVEAIVRMFPSTAVAQNFEFGQLDPSTFTDPAHQYQTPGTSNDQMLYDPLFGFMDGFDLQAGGT